MDCIEKRPGPLRDKFNLKWTPINLCEVEPNCIAIRHVIVGPCQAGVGGSGESNTQSRCVSNFFDSSLKRFRPPKCEAHKITILVKTTLLALLAKTYSTAIKPGVQELTKRGPAKDMIMG